MHISRLIITFCIIALPIIGVIAPRAFSFIPPTLGLIAFIEYIFTYKKTPKIDWVLLSFISVFLMFAGISYFWAVNPDATIMRVIKLTAIIIPSLLLLFTARSVNIVNIQAFKYLPYTLIFASILLIIETYLKYPIYHFLRSLPAEEVVAPAKINWSLIIISLLIWPVLLNLWLEKNKLLIPAVLIAVFSAIFSATSQSAMVALIFGSLSLFLSFKKPKCLLYAICSATIIGIIISPWLAQWLYNLRPEILVDWRNASAGQRMELWDFVARRALEQPWYGWGIEATKYIKDFDSAQILYLRTRVFHPHNFALQLWIELGIIGALSGVIFIYLCLKHFLLFNEKYLKFIIACFTATLVVNLVGYGVWQSWLVGLQLTVALLFVVTVKMNEGIKEIE